VALALASPVPKVKPPDEMTNPMALTEGACPSYAPTSSCASQSAEPSRHEPTQPSIHPAFAYIAVAVALALAPAAWHRGLPQFERELLRARIRSIEDRGYGHLVYRNRESVPHDYARSKRGREATKRCTSTPRPWSAERSGGRWTGLTRGSILSGSKFQRNKRRARCAARSETGIPSESATRHHPRRLGVR
jgi:hypothetical protein